MTIVDLYRKLPQPFLVEGRFTIEHPILQCISGNFSIIEKDHKNLTGITICELNSLDVAFGPAQTKWDQILGTCIRLIEEGKI